LGGRERSRLLVVRKAASFSINGSLLRAEREACKCRTQVIVMTKAQTRAFWQQLLALGRRLKGDVSSLATEALQKSGGGPGSNLSNTPVHPADLGSDNYQQDVALSLLESQEHMLEEVAAALDRIEMGTFGSCESCGQPISQERLKALAFTRHCLLCSQKFARLSLPGNL
jgi:RNA polymerase-binding transcription factor DksA